jgi:RimJ/RimL family protein N-acetyltransferase
VIADVALRETIDADLGTLFKFQADPEASAMAAFPSRDLPAFLEHQAKIKADPSMITRTIVNGPEVVGSIGSWEVEGERDVGFWIGRDHWGNGYATAALRAFLVVDLHRPLLAHVADHNVGSRRVLEYRRARASLVGRTDRRERLLCRSPEHERRALARIQKKVAGFHEVGILPVDSVDDAPFSVPLEADLVQVAPCD